MDSLSVPTQANSVDRCVAALIEEMRQGVEHAPAIYRPGTFWEAVIASNLEMLQTEGITSFKRTVSNNYFNWMVTSPRDRQLRRAVIEWVRHPTLAPLTNTVESATGLRTLLHRRSFALSPLAGHCYKFFVGVAWERARRDDPMGLTERLSEPEVGNPIRVCHRGRPISQDLANSVIELAFVTRSGAIRSGCRVAELGGGYGRLAHVFSEALPLTYCIFDIPPALAVAQWYLTSILGADRVVPYAAHSDFSELERRLRPGAVAFLTPDQLEMFPDGWFDCAQTISTLPEMPAQQSARYLELLSAKSSRAIFLKQWQDGRNIADDVELPESHYKLAPPWRLAVRRADPIHRAFFNQLWLRPAH